MKLNCENKCGHTDIFAANLVTLRKEHRLKQKELGKILDVSRTAISLYEKGEKKPSYRTLYRLGEYFGVSLNWLMGINASKAEINNK